jgi:hypothetical protein
VDLFDVTGDVFVVVGLDVHCPLMRVAVLFAFLTEISSDVAVNNRFDNTHSLQELTVIFTHDRSKTFTFSLPPESGPKSVGKLILFCVRLVTLST